MVNNAGIEIGAIPVAAREEDIIRSTKKVATKEVTVGLQRVIPTVPAPPEALPPMPDFVPFIPPEVPEKKRLILNIETDGYRPWENRIISIGYQDPMVPNGVPTVIMLADEAMILTSLFAVIREGDYNELIGYGLAFDYRFLLIKAMKYNIDCKEFYDMDLYDLMQAMAQGKLAFVYKPQSAPKLSELADYLWGYPKPFTDLEMIKYYAQGQFDKVVEFTSSQIIRIMALYSLFRKVSETPFTLTSLGIASEGSSPITNPQSSEPSKLTIPEARMPETWTAKCPECLAESEVPINLSEYVCKICGTTIRR